MRKEERLIVALDVNSEEKALELVDELKNEVKLFKVGLELFSSCGPKVIKTIKGKDCEVFLDLKFHDIPNTVAKAAASVTQFGISILNVHALGGYDMMKMASEAVKSQAETLKIQKPKLIAVTILTSMDENNLKKIGINDNMETQVLKLAKLAKDAGLDGVVASPSEVKLIRKNLGDNFLVVAPGVRPSWSAKNDPSTGSGSVLSLSKDDQKRVATPKEAIDNGADFIVVGRPITQAPDPAEAARRVLKEIE